MKYQDVVAIKKVDVQVESSVRVSFRCDCGAPMIKTAQNRDSQLSVRCGMCGLILVKDGHVWKRSNVVKNLNGNKWQEVEGEPVKTPVSVSETTDISNVSFICPNCLVASSQKNEPVYPGEPDWSRKGIIHVFKDHNGQRHTGELLRCLHCGMCLSFQNYEWRIVSEGDPSKTVRLVEEEKTYTVQPTQVTQLRFVCPNPSCGEHNLVDITDKKLPIPAFICVRCQKPARRHKDHYRMVIKSKWFEKINKTAETAQI